MFFWVILIIGIVIFIYQKYFSEKGFESQLNKIENKAYKMNYQIKESIEKGIKELEKKDKKEKDFSILGKNFYKDMIKGQKEGLDRLNLMRAYFIRLKEKYKFSSRQERLEIYQGWFDFLSSCHDVDEEELLIMNEIEKKFRNKLS